MLQSLDRYATVVNGVMNMKITRLFFQFDNGKEFFIDRAYDEAKQPQENCDATLKFFSQLMDDGKNIAAMCAMPSPDDPGKLVPMPALVNLKMAAVVHIKNIAVYEAEESNEVKDPNEVKAEVIDD
jgi:hypothetical protein